MVPDMFFKECMMEWASSVQDLTATMPILALLPEIVLAVHSALVRQNVSPNCHGDDRPRCEDSLPPSLLRPGSPGCPEEKRQKREKAAEKMRQYSIIAQDQEPCLAGSWETPERRKMRRPEASSPLLVTSSSEDEEASDSDPEWAARFDWLPRECCIHPKRVGSRSKRFKPEQSWLRAACSLGEPSS
eukprot:s900_g6.t1